MRNEVLKQLGELADELRYQMKQPDSSRETDVLIEVMTACLKDFDEYIRLVPPKEREFALNAVYPSASASKGA